MKSKSSFSIIHIFTIKPPFTNHPSRPFFTYGHYKEPLEERVPHHQFSFMHISLHHSITISCRKQPYHTSNNTSCFTLSTSACHLPKLKNQWQLHLATKEEKTSSQWRKTGNSMHGDTDQFSMGFKPNG